MNPHLFPIPIEEKRRLAALPKYDILNTIPKEELDKLTALTASIFNVPIALISLVDEKKGWLKSGFGISLSQTIHSESFCRYTMMSKQVLEVENILTDSRFSGSPLVIEAPFIRYYCGVPLLNQAGDMIGSLGILDTVTRKLDDAQMKTLGLQAQQIVHIFELYHKRKQVEKEKNQFATSEALFSTIFRLNPFPTSITRLSDGKILHVNEQGLKAFGYSDEEVINRTTAQLNVWENTLEREELVKRLAVEHKVNGFQATFRQKGGQLWIALLSLEVIQWDGETCILWIMQDITERRKVEEAIHSYTRQLEEVNANKDKFFSIIAHDMLSPLNGILGSSNLLSEYMAHLSKEDIQELSRTINLSTANLKRLLSNLLEWARMQIGAIAFEPKQVNLRKVAEKVIELLKDNAHSKVITIDNKLEEDIYLRADENMAESILRNLLANGIKFSGQGTKITLTATLLPCYVQVSVQDQGIGMSKELQDQLFKFGITQSTLGTANEKGTGLGLLLCKDFVEKHSGRIWVESQPGKGTTFIFTLAR
ncbi:PAS domain S-box protein [Rhodocytophaga rosea]|uniref:histidine kinase n=1 Tax=Rhodocytophaga rosea TaxID=2704465 RepID=A0A6C0GTY8_9BACT|nr:ATP-binding protein [Rhodocytophaga rosea]QHT71506.1 PAS domain S-box protein [Rhodocytophaga rosea]